MSDRNSHIEDSFIPEGLEFREEYMHAALGNYRKRKRALVWRKVGVAALIFMAVLTGTLALWTPSERGIQAEESNTSSTIEQEKIITDSLSTIDLDNDEGTFNKNRQSPAVESSEATRDLSVKAVDEGDPMSSGVGLPGQLSTSKGNLQSKARAPSLPESRFSGTKENHGEATTIHNNSQQIGFESLKNEAFNKKDTPSELAYLSVELLSNDQQLQPHRPLPLVPISRWSVYASVGTKLWAEYGFGSGPRKLDPVVGLGVEYKWSKKMSFMVAGQFFTVSGVAVPYVSTLREYGEGFTEKTYSYHTERFYHAGLSLGAAYRLNHKHSLSLFAESTALLTADNRVETGSASSYESRTTNSVKARGYVQGFRGIQHSVGFGYEYALGKNKSLGVNYRQGLTDVTLNSYFGDQLNRNSMLTLYFKIKLTP